MSRFGDQLLEALGRNTRAYRDASDSDDEPAVAALGAVSVVNTGVVIGDVPQGDAPPAEPETEEKEEQRLSEKEISLLAEISTGITTETAARRLAISTSDLRRQLRAICDKLGVHTPIEAVVWAVRERLI